MRRFDKIKNIKKINILTERRYLQSKGLLKENYNIENLSNEDYIQNFLDNFYVGLDDIQYDLEKLFVDFNLKYYDDDINSSYSVEMIFDVEGFSMNVILINFYIGWDEEKQDFLKTFKLKYSDSFKPVVDYIQKEFIRRYDKGEL